MYIALTFKLNMLIVIILFKDIKALVIIIYLNITYLILFLYRLKSNKIRTDLAEV